MSEHSNGNPFGTILGTMFGLLYSLINNHFVIDGLLFPLVAGIMGGFGAFLFNIIVKKINKKRNRNAKRIH